MSNQSEAVRQPYNLGLGNTIPQESLKVYVDQDRGSDIRGKRTYSGFPFQTLRGALRVSKPGDCIVVRASGSPYNERPIGKTGVNWFFEPNSEVRYTGREIGGIFDDSSNGTDGAMTIKVFGAGSFHLESVQTGSPPGFQGCINITNASSNYYIEAYNISNGIANGTSAQRAAIYADSGICKVYARNKISSDYYDAVICGNLLQNTLVVTADEIEGDDNAVEYCGGDMYVHARTLRAVNACVSLAWIEAAGKGVVVVDNMLSTGEEQDVIYGDSPDDGVDITCRLIESTSGAGIYLNSGLLRINDARVQGGTDKSAVIMAGGTLVLKDTVLLKNGSATDAISGSGGVIKRYGGLDTNGTKSVLVNISVGTYPTADADVG